VSTAYLTATVAGLRTCPPGVTGEAKAEWDAGESAWRLLHAVTLYEIYRARCRTHAAYHASPQTSPKATSTKHVVRRIKLRLQQRIEYEHEKAKHARQHSHEEGPMAAFQRVVFVLGLVSLINPLTSGKTINYLRQKLKLCMKFGRKQLLPRLRQGATPPSF